MMNRPDLDALGADLQAELRLVDWSVTYVYVPDLCDAAGNAVYGLCDRLVDNKTATIAIRDPLASQPLPAGAENKPVESVLMHELVHLHMAPLAVNTPQGITAEEQAVWPIAEALTRWRGTARGEMAARAMRSGPQTIQKKEIRKMGAAAKALAMLKAAMESDGVKEDSAASRCLAALMADDEKPAGEAKPPEAAPARAAEVEDKDREAAAAKARAAEPPPFKAAAMTIAEVEQRSAVVAARVFGEHSERAAIITNMGDKLTADERTVWGALPLPTVKQLAAARGTGATVTPGTQRAARGGVGPLGPLLTDPLAGVPAEHREDTARAVQRVARAFGLETDKRPAIEINSRGMSLSNVGSIQEQHADLVRTGQLAVQQGRA